MLFTLTPVIFVFYGDYRDIYIPFYPKSTNDNGTNDSSTIHNSTGTNNIKKNTISAYAKIVIDPAHDTNKSLYIYAFPR